MALKENVHLILNPRTVLREYREEDIDEVARYTSDPGVVEHLPWGPLDRERSARFLRKAIRAQSEVPRMRFDLAICLGKEGTLMGGSGIFVSSLVNRQATICYWLGRPFWDHGYGTETAAGLLHFGFSTLGLHKIVATCSVDNQRSRRILERLHMRLEGILKDDVWQRTQWRDSCLFAILDTEWHSVKDDFLFRQNTVVSR